MGKAHQLSIEEAVEYSFMHLGHFIPTTPFWKNYCGDDVVNDTLQWRKRRGIQIFEIFFGGVFLHTKHNTANLEIIVPDQFNKPITVENVQITTKNTVTNSNFSSLNSGIHLFILNI